LSLFKKGTLGPATGRGARRGIAIVGRDIE